MNALERKVSLGGVAMCAITGLAWLWWGLQYPFSPHNGVRFIVSLLGLALLALSIYLFVRRRKSHAPWVLSLFAFFLFYWIIDLGAICITPRIHLPSNRPEGVRFHNLFDSTIAQFDPVIGYRWVPGDHRITLMADAELIYDVRFHTNRQGFVSPFDFLSSKPDSATTRLLVMGDSFSAGILNHASWPTRFMELWQSNPRYQKLELYNFSIDGGGTVNWHQILMHEILPHYAFDGVIFAVAENDLARPFFAMNHDASGEHAGYLDSPPPYSYSQFISSPLILHKPIQLSTRTDALIDSIAQLTDTPLPPSFLYFPALLEYRHAYADESEATSTYYDMQLRPSGIQFNADSVEKTMGHLQFSMMNTMLDTLQALDKKVFLVTVPDQTELIAEESGQVTTKSLCLLHFACTHDLPMYDGIQGLRGFSSADHAQMYYRFDYHWNQKGIEAFLPPFLRWIETQLRAGPQQ